MLHGDDGMAVQDISRAPREVMDSQIVDNSKYGAQQHGFIQKNQLTRGISKMFRNITFKKLHRKLLKGDVRPNCKQAQ